MAEKPDTIELMLGTRGFCALVYQTSPNEGVEAKFYLANNRIDYEHLREENQITDGSIIFDSQGRNLTQSQFLAVNHFIASPADARKPDSPAVNRLLQILREGAKA